MKPPQKINVQTLDINNTFLEVDGVGWRTKLHMSVKDIMDQMQLDIPEESNVTLVTFEDQDTSINRPPNTYPLDHSLNLAVDENFLYVWINERWKRIPLSIF